MLASMLCSNMVGPHWPDFLSCCFPLQNFSLSHSLLPGPPFFLARHVCSYEALPLNPDDSSRRCPAADAVNAQAPIIMTISPAPSCQPAPVRLYPRTLWLQAHWLPTVPSRTHQKARVTYYTRERTEPVAARWRPNTHSLSL